MLTLLLVIVVALLSTAVTWKGSVLLERSAERLSRYYRFPEIVHGALIVAIGSSFPELSTTVLSTAIHGEFELGVSAIVGSAIFNILVIPGASALLGGPLHANRDLVYKEAQFYMLSVAVLLLTFSFAAIYYPVTDGPLGTIEGQVNRALAAIPLAVYGLYVWLQVQDTLDDRAPEPEEEIRPGREYLVLGLSLVLILGGVEGLVWGAIELGKLSGTPSFLWGATVVAAGTSLPDALVSVRAAKSGRSVTSLANALGSNVFDLLVAIPVGVLIAGTAVIDYSVAAPMMGVLTLATLLLFVVMRAQMIVTRKDGWLLLIVYLAFVVWLGGESFGLVDWVPGLPP